MFLRTNVNYKPDVCVLAKKASASSGSETMHEWFDYFKGHAELWPELEATLKANAEAAAAQAARKAERMSKLASNNNNSSSSRGKGSNEDTATAAVRGSAGRGSKRKAGELVAAAAATTAAAVDNKKAKSAAEVSLPATQEKEGADKAAGDDENSGDKAPVDEQQNDPIVAAMTAMYRGRFAHAVNDIEKSGFVRVHAGGRVVTRQAFTWT
jgi:hypothetical protein